MTLSKREWTLTLIAGLGLAVGLVYAFVALLILPVIEKGDRNADLEVENDTLQSDFEWREAKNRKAMAKLAPRSLPADLDLAKTEYASTLSRLILASRVPAGFTVNEKPADGKGIPELAKNEPAYKKIAFAITMSKVDIATLMGFLKRYYELDILHQITTFTIKRDDNSKIGDDARPAKDRTDLNVTLVTEAIQLAGAPVRKTLLAAPISAGLVLGGAGLYSLEHTTADIGRGIAPYGPEKVLATVARDYALVAARDVLHGKLPAPPPIKPKDKEPTKQPDPPGPDISPYIRLVSIVKSSDGSAHVELTDLWNNFDFEIDLEQKGEKLSVTAIRYRKEKPSDANPSGRIVDKTYPGGGMLAFSDDKSRTKRLFKIYGIDGIAIVLGETGAIEPKPAGGKPPIDPKPAPSMVEKFYRWEVGVPLKEIKELNPDEAQKAIRRALGGLLDVSGPVPDSRPGSDDE